VKEEDVHALESIEKLHNYNSYIFEKIYNKGISKEILDFGCGYGTFIDYLKKKFNLEIIGYEINPEAIEKLNTKRINTISSLEKNKENFDYIVSLNVLEHIKNDEKTIEDLNFLLKDSGILILYLPHSMKIWTDLDELVGHYRRYTRKDLFTKLEQAGFNIISWEYVDFIGWIALYLSKLLRINLNYEEKRLIKYDKYIFKFLKYLDVLFKYFVGKNILVVCRKKK
tara:strand:- start:1753 stop:2430 length:678 start_codon:yes stop_codon:yes gene_type:complete